MTIPAIAPIGALPTITPVAASTNSTSGADFATALGKGLDAVQSAQSNADHLAVQASTGDLTDISDYTIAATQASLMTQLMSTLSDKGISAINQIMGMQA